MDSKDLLNTGLHFPAFGYPSRAAREGATIEGHPVPGLGAENDVRGSSLWTYDVAIPIAAHLLAKLRLGETISKDSPTPREAGHWWRGTDRRRRRCGLCVCFARSPGQCCRDYGRRNQAAP